MNLEPKAGFDWGRITWGRPDSVVSALCSYCSAAIGEDDMPLKMFQRDGHAAQFCASCQSRWFGLETCAFCAACDEENEFGRIICKACGKPLVFEK